MMENTIPFPQKAALVPASATRRQVRGGKSKIASFPQNMLHSELESTALVLTTATRGWFGGGNCLLFATRILPSKSAKKAIKNTMTVVGLCVGQITHIETGAMPF